ncbi:MAG: cysteine desulfurase NifS [Candidatus Magasanikbacteria bacterium CG_4_10_14_0_2_um_filter_33_14]|uniref:Cysteine desulfurase NifS n=1 Tax=Candidatus Magasanikbacteria bacterium CG_4_10_14_0_2_um_filter_33_14 TaxID=1974636 RepID=A0A2M7VC44_9BACT|nr:MAG: cysteine desulfurase NifS [Candidatus Magasanikbacteria bacterium CG_4_10_14_0_2_um_filter_33_14]
MSFPKKPENKRTVYFDHAATTYVDDVVLEEMQPYFSDIYANPSGLYAIGREVNGALEDARRRIAQILHTLPDTIFFTGGGTESDNMAILGVVRKHEKNGKHIITTKIEHHAVLYPCEYLEKHGFEVTYLTPDEQGFVTPKQVKEALRADTILVSVMYANNEIGTVEPLADIGRELLKWRKENNTKYPYFHTDACQAAGAFDLDVEKLHVDLMTINASKLYGPKGVGILYKHRNVSIEPIIFGGGQERGLRSGTENVPGIVGFAKALEMAQENNEVENKRLTELRNYFWERLDKEIPKMRLNGPALDKEDLRLPNNLNVSVLDIEGEALLLYLDEYGIVCSTGSACTSESLDPSHVLLACGLPYEYAHGSLRFTLGKRTTKEDIDYSMKYLPGIVDILRKISPVNLQEDAKKNTHPQYLQ